VPEQQVYVHDGPLPAVRSVGDDESETGLLTAYLNGAARELRLTLGSCAVLVPTNDGGRKLADRLSAAGTPAIFQESQAVDITAKEVKVITLASSKGLEFPIVAVADLRNPSYPYVPPAAPLQSVMEILAKERRTMFVAMTRAMRAMLVLPPEGSDSTLFEGFDDGRWNVS
jgi:superfamily I DNA/RNA helicase